MALIVRLAAFLAGGQVEPIGGLENGYFAAAATAVSGYGFMMHTPRAVETNFGFERPIRVNEYMRVREAAGGRVDRQHPFPKSAEHWLPATLHPLGYSSLIAGLYTLVNYTGTIWSLRLLQIAADSVACLFVFVFARNVFDPRTGRIAAWLYALCPPAIFLSLCVLLPDSFQGFFLALILALASFALAGKLRLVLLGGVVLGVSCHFRMENMLLPGVLFLVFWASLGRPLAALKYAAALAAPAFVILLPFALWMKSAVGEFRLTSTNAGATAYSAIGEDPENPWGIGYADTAIEEDARRHGFASAWSAEADRYYGQRFVEYIKTHPGRYFRMVLFQRLPLALAAPYPAWLRATLDEFSFDKLRQEEGLGRWGAVRKYPLRVLRYLWRQAAMMLYSGTLTLCVLGVALLRRRDWRRLAWIMLPWVSTIFIIAMLKGVEPRNVSSTLIPGVIAAALLLAMFWERRCSSAAPAAGSA